MQSLLDALGMGPRTEAPADPPITPSPPPVVVSSASSFENLMRTSATDDLKSAGAEDEERAEEVAAPGGTKRMDLQTALRVIDSIRSSMECSLCLSTLTHPVTIACQHTFCSACLRRALATSPVCPLCRAPCFFFDARINARSRPHNIVLEKILAATVPESSANKAFVLAGDGSSQLGPETPTQRLSLFAVGPQFFAAPGHKVALRVFEPRYILLIQRCLDDGICFGIPISHDSRRGVVLRVDRAQEGRPPLRSSQHDALLGRRLLVVECTVEARYVAEEDPVEETGTGGLMTLMARIVQDEEGESNPNSEEVVAAERRAREALRSRLVALTPTDLSIVDRYMGTIPSAASDFSFYLVRLVKWKSHDERDEAVFGMSLKSRLTLCTKMLESPDLELEPVVAAATRRRNKWTWNTVVVAGIACAFAALISIDL